ncbi:MAG: hypothetical protein QOF46_1706, partial [Paraburkholderia sp.]|nr:hypothetical protein [Paraburkholderia sp.]
MAYAARVTRLVIAAGSAVRYPTAALKFATGTPAVAGAAARSLLPPHALSIDAVARPP